MASLAVICFGFFVKDSYAIENRGAFYIKNFNVDIFVNEDSSIEVEEMIDVNFSQRRHGIFRKIPVKYNNDNGFKYNMKLDVISVLDERGNSYKYDEYKEGRDVVLKIGDPNFEVIGDVKYIIHYKVQGGVRFFDDHDEIYWNPIGTGWPTQIFNATSTIYLNERVSGIGDGAVCFTGEFGSKESSCRITSVSNDEVTFEALRALNNYEGMTVAINLPKGVVHEPSGGEKLLMFLADNWGFAIPILLFGGMLYLWYFRGKELELRRANIAQYGPPEKLTPGEVGYLMKESYANHFVAADIVNLAVKGYIEIREISSDKMTLLLGKGKKISKKIRSVIIVVFFVYILFSVIPFVTMGEFHFAKLVYTIASVAIFLSFFSIVKRVAKKSNLFVDYELENKKDWANAKDLTEHEKRLLKGLFASKVLGKIKLSKKKKFYTHVQIASRKVAEQIKAKGYFENSWVNSKALYVVGGIILGFVMFMIGSATQRLDFILSAILSGLTLIVFGVLMSKKTMKGAEAYWHAKGYKHYIDIAEKYRVQFNEKENIFEKTLPYAMVFGNVDKWAKAFEGMMDKEPSWYHSSSGVGGFRPTTFSNNLSSGFAAAATAASVSPSSSSSGGSSGGGGGGGGGGSW